MVKTAGFATHLQWAEGVRVATQKALSESKGAEAVNTPVGG